MNFVTAWPFLFPIFSGSEQPLAKFKLLLLRFCSWLHFLLSLLVLLLPPLLMMIILFVRKFSLLFAQIVFCRHCHKK